MNAQYETPGSYFDYIYKAHLLKRLSHLNQHLLPRPPKLLRLSTNCLDMVLAVKPFLAACDITPEFDDIMLMGYSQGGANTMGIMRMIETEYADQITDVHFLCKPPLGSVPHMNIIEHDRQFRIEILSCSDFAAYAEAMEEVMKGCGLPVTSVPERDFLTPLTNWRDGIKLD